jgi:hypothetical protein
MPSIARAPSNPFKANPLWGWESRGPDWAKEGRDPGYFPLTATSQLVIAVLLIQETGQVFLMKKSSSKTTR